MIKQSIDIFCIYFILFLFDIKLKKCATVVCEDSFLIVYCPNKYKTHKIQKICDEAVNDSLSALKVIPDWFVSTKIIEVLFTALYADENILHFNDSGNVVFSCNEMGINDFTLIIILIKMIWYYWSY